MFGLGYQELLLILVIVLILFGAQRLPDLAKSLGSSVKEFKKGVSEITKDDTAAARRRLRHRRRRKRRRRRSSRTCGRGASSGVSPDPLPRGSCLSLTSASRSGWRC